MTMLPTASTSDTASNTSLLKDMRGPVARFYPIDLHTHSLGSFDVCQGPAYDALPTSLKGLVARCVAQPTDPAQYDLTLTTATNVSAFFDCLVARRNEVAEEQRLGETDKWALVAITDHNTAHFSAALSKHAWAQRHNAQLVLFPGMELEVEFCPVEGSDICKVHLLLIYAPLVDASSIRLSVCTAAGHDERSWDFGKPLAVRDLPAFVNSLRAHHEYPASCIAAHVWSNKGIQSEAKKLLLDRLDVEIARATAERAHANETGLHSAIKELDAHIQSLVESRGEEEIGLEVLSLIGNCGFDALQVRDQTHERHYRRLHRFREEQGRAVPIVCSDAHTPTSLFSCFGNTAYGKVSVPLSSAAAEDVFDDLRNHILRYGETRLTYRPPGAVTQWIDGIEVSGDSETPREFWRTTTPNSFRLPLSRNLNCLVGGRGSGKSAVIEAIGFVTRPTEYTAEAQKNTKDQSDWYARAVATLSGCTVRVIWKSTSSDGVGALRRRALFASRYFDSSGTHGAVQFRNIDGDPPTDGMLLPTVRLLRAHDIERTADATHLRQLFDELCGPEKDVYDREIADIRIQLQIQRGEILETIEAINALCHERSPLRQYGIRKRLFDQVDRADLRDTYAEVDAAVAKAEQLDHVKDEWQSIELDRRLREMSQDVDNFVASSKAQVVDEEGAAKEGREELFSMLEGKADGAFKEISQLKGAIDGAVAGNTAVVTRLSAFTDSATTAGEVAKSELEKAGVPAGAGEREAKRKSFAEAQACLVEYEDLLKSLNEALDARSELRARLVSACDERANLREETGRRLTAQLASDLDDSVLRIDIRCLRHSDKSELEGWLQSCVSAHIPRYKPQRIAALCAKLSDCSELRTALWSDGDPDGSPIEIAGDRQEDGRINQQEAGALVQALRARTLEQLDDSSDWDATFLSSLPDSISSGICVFPASSNVCTADNVLLLDEVVLDDLPEVLLNDRPNDEESVARPLSELSLGQRCSAILPILLLSGEYPLIIDQPEENLDNRLIRQVIVNILASMKLRRQVIVATHNPNLPVLGDAEQCVALEAIGRDQSRVVATGDLDASEVASYITEIMEGGREAFQYRHTIYQTHWCKAVE